MNRSYWMTGNYLKGRSAKAAALRERTPAMTPKDGEEKLIQEIKHIIITRDELLKEIEDAHEILIRFGVEGDDLPLADRIKLMHKEQNVQFQCKTFFEECQPPWFLFGPVERGD